jgi:hypothetical protein
MNKLNVFSKSPKFSNERTFLENKKLLEKKRRYPLLFQRRMKGHE